MSLETQVDRGERLRIGYSFDTYLERRTVVGLVPECDYTIARDLYWAMRVVRHLLRMKWSDYASDIQYRFTALGLGSYDLLHLFNGVSFDRRPWISTYETVLPRYKNALAMLHTGEVVPPVDENIRRALDAMASSHCRRLIGISRNAVDIQNGFLDGFPDHRDVIVPKQAFVQIPQPVAAFGKSREYPDDSPGRPLRFMLVGHEFFRKGGMEVLKVLERYRKTEKAPVHLTIVSSLLSGDYATRSTQDDVNVVKRLIADNSDWVEHYDSLPHARVMKLMEQADVGLLASYAETYGFSILEFQSSGCPVISTDVRAMPEINDDDVGWTLEVPKGRNREAAHYEEGGVEAISDAIEVGLSRVVSEILESPSTVRDKGQKAYEKIRRDHDPRLVAQKLAVVYRESLDA